MARENQTARAGLAFSTSLALLDFAAQIDEEAESALGALGLSRRKLCVLGHLERSPGLSFTELARRAEITYRA